MPKQKKPITPAQRKKEELHKKFGSAMTRTEKLKEMMPESKRYGMPMTRKEKMMEVRKNPKKTTKK